MKGKNLDLTSGSLSDDSEHQSTTESQSDSASPTCDTRKFLGVRFDCCDVYRRIYINRDESAYVGHCPRCGKAIRFNVGPGGTDNRFFSAG